jgi:hemerythrin
MNIHGIDELVWSVEMATGHLAIDVTHHEFIELVNALADADDQAMLDRLIAFQVHAQRHFSEEDLLMNNTAYPSAGCHVDEHAAVLRSIAEVIELVEKGRFDIGRDLTAELISWFPRHTEHMDQSLVRWLVKHSTGGSPVKFHRERPP